MKSATRCLTTVDRYSFTGADAGASTMDPHSLVDEGNKGAIKQVYEALLDINSNLKIVPQLAIAWKIVDPTHWDFELRQGVRFHDGTPFTADDVVFSLERARAATSDFRDYVDGIAAVVAIDDLTVRVTTTRPDPSLWLKLAEVAIMSRAWAEAHGVHVPANVKAGKETFASRHANGTGPFRLEAFEPYGRWAMVRNPAWWGTADFPHNIDRIVHLPKRDPENVAALLDGKIDLLQTVPYWAVDQIRSNPDLKLVYRPKLLTLFFGLDRAARSCARPTSRGATRSRTNGCVRPWPTRWT